MSKETMKKLSNFIFWGTTIFAVVTLIIIGKDYLAVSHEGVCVINKNNGLIYTALFLLIVSMIITSILDHKVKTMAKNEEPAADIYDQTLEVMKNEELKSKNETLEKASDENKLEKEMDNEINRDPKDANKDEE